MKSTSDQGNAHARMLLALGAVLSCTAVVAGAFGSHALTGAVEAGRLDTFETAARYQMYHGLALVVLSMLFRIRMTILLKTSAVLLVCGTALFSGSLYTLVLLDLPILGAITPVGGVALVLGWLALAASALKDV